MKKQVLFYALLIALLTGFIAGAEERGKQPGKTLSVLVIDPGHGGKDPGAVSGNAMEKNIVLDISLRLGNLITHTFPEIKVIYTRNRDIFVPLHERAGVANKNKADLFISIHANYVNSSSVQGTETYVLGQHRTSENLEVAKKENAVILLEDDYTATYEGFDPNLPESYIMFELVQDEYLEQSVTLASTIQDQFREKANRHDRSVRQAGFLVLRQVAMPAVLVEAGFLSHTSERNYLMTENGREDIANSIFNAFVNYKQKIEEKSTFAMNTHANKANKNNPGSSGNTNSTTKGNSPQETQQQANIHFSVQVAALKKSQDPSPENFKGEKNVYRITSQGINRYFSGTFKTFDQAETERKRLSKKFPDAFIVAFKNDRQISVEQALGER